MAVKQYEKQMIQEKQVDITAILEIVQALSSNPESLPNGADLVRLCEYIVKVLGQVPTPREATLLKPFKEDVVKILSCLNDICESRTEEQEAIVTACLKVLYSLITSINEPSEAVSIILQLFDNSLIPRAVSWILSNYDHSSDEALKTGFIVLCKWLRTTNFTPSLHIWIIEILNKLREQQKFDLLLDISLNVIEPLFLSLIIPIIRPKVAPVIQRILSSVRHSPIVFHKIIGRAPKVLQKLKHDELYPHQRAIQDLIDTIAALLLFFPGYDDLYKETEEVLRLFSTSPDFRSVLDVPPWSLEVSKSGINARVGLVNLGNTCYMNSVLQALVMTKQFSREILLSNSKTPLLIKIQQLLALLLHSTRPELTPRAVLHATRPPGFLPGYQQDSSEFLGHLLETLHEQEKQLVSSRALHDDDIIEDQENKNSEIVMDLDGKLGRWKTESSLNNDGDHHNIQNKLKRLRNIDKLDKYSTLIQRTFGGQISITCECLNCGEKSTNNDAFRDVQLSFPDEKNDISQTYSVQNLLDYYCSSEKLDGDNQYYCQKCEKLCDGLRSIKFVSAPRNLIMTLKHFKYDQKYHIRAKLMHKTYHDEVITLKVYSDNAYQQSTIIKYVLYAAVVHSGISMDAGHYYTYAADHPNCWYKFNDNFVSKCSIEDLHNLSPPNTPYILFYQRESPDQLVTSSHLELPTGGATANAIQQQQQQQEQEQNLQNGHDMLPALEELPRHLRDFIINDNVSYYEEVKHETSRQQQKKPVSAVFEPKNDREDDPPNSCGGNTINYCNRFIF